MCGGERRERPRELAHVDHLVEDRDEVLGENAHLRAGSAGGELRDVNRSAADDRRDGFGGAGTVADPVDRGGRDGGELVGDDRPHGPAVV
jgi:hypothetical protein